MLPGKALTGSHGASCQSGVNGTAHGTRGNEGMRTGQSKRGKPRGRRTAYVSTARVARTARRVRHTVRTGAAVAIHVTSGTSWVCCWMAGRTLRTCVVSRWQPLRQNEPKAQEPVYARAMPSMLQKGVTALAGLRQNKGRRYWLMRRENQVTNQVAAGCSRQAVSARTTEAEPNALVTTTTRPRLLVNRLGNTKMSGNEPRVYVRQAGQTPRYAYVAACAGTSCVCVNRCRCVEWR